MPTRSSAGSRRGVAFRLRRGTVAVPLGYYSDLRAAIAAMREAAQKTEGVLAEPPASVRVQELEPDDILLEARCWTDSRRSDFMTTASNVRAAVIEAFKAAHIGLPEPDVRILVPRSSR